MGLIVCDGDGIVPCLKLDRLKVLCENEQNQTFKKSKKKVLRPDQRFH